MKLKKRSRKKIREVREIIQDLPMTAEMLPYISIYQSLQELYFQGEYEIVDNLCDALLNG